MIERASQVVRSVPADVVVDVSPLTDVQCYRLVVAFDHELRSFARDRQQKVLDDGGVWLTKQQLAVRLRCSTKTVDRRREEPGFPKPCCNGSRLLWRRSEVESWEALRPRG